MKIKTVSYNNREKGFELSAGNKILSFPYANLRLKPGVKNKIAKVFVDPELGDEAFTYSLEDGREDSVNLDEVLEYNKDPHYMKDMLLYRLTLEAQECLKTSRLSRREIIRRLGTSASQFYRLLDQTNYKKSIDQVLLLLSVLNCKVDFVIEKEGTRGKDFVPRKKSGKAAACSANQSNYINLK